MLGRRSPTLLSLLALAAVLVLLGAASLRKIWGADFWWQYAAGRLVAEQGIPRVDPFSYTANGSPWIELRWLYCLGLHRLAEWIGFSGIVVLKALAVATAFVFAALPRFSARSATITAAVLTLAILASSQRFFVRPELVTYVFLAAFAWILDRHRSGRDGRLVFVLPLLQIVWTNSHTLFVFGPLLTGLLALVMAASWAGGSDAHRRRTKTAALVFGLTTLACFLNPYGIEGLRFPFRLFEEIRGTAFKETIGEFRSPFAFSQSYPAVAFYEGLIAVCVASVLVNLRRLDPFWTILVAAQVYLSSLAIRNLPLFALAAVPFVLHNLRSSPLANRLGGRARRVAEAVTAVVVIAVALGYARDLATNRFSVRSGDTNQAGLGLAEHRYPEAAVRFLDEKRVAGPIFHTMREGAYLLAHGRDVFVDPRLEVYGEDRYVEFLNAASGGLGWARTLREHGCRTALLGHDAGLADELLTSAEWRLAHFDEVALVFRRTEDAGAEFLRTRQDLERVVREIRERLPTPPPGEAAGPFERVVSPKPYKRVATVLMTLDRPDLALPFFVDAVAAFPNDVDALRSCASLHGVLGDFESATELLEDGLRRWPDDSWMLRELGAHRFNAGQIDEANRLGESALRADPQNASAWSLLARVRWAHKDLAGAVEAARRAADLEPENEGYRRELEFYRSLPAAD